MIEKLKSAWRRYRGLPGWGQAAIAVVVAVVLIAGAASGDDGKAPTASENTTTTTTTEPETEEPSAPSGDTWTYTDGDGTTHAIECDDDTSCTEGTPGPIGMIDLAADSGCEAITTERDFWANSGVGDDETQANGRAYVAYANDRLAELGC